MVNFYHVLGIGRHADERTIGVAYQILTRRFETEPDAAVGVQADSKQMIQEAHDVLSDPVARRAYDKALSRHQRARWAKFASSAFVGLFGAAAMTLVLAVFLRFDFDTAETGQRAVVASVAPDFHPETGAGEQSRSATPIASFAARLHVPGEPSPDAAKSISTPAIGPEDDVALRHRINRFAPEATGYLKVNSWQQALSGAEPGGKDEPENEGRVIASEPVLLPTKKLAQLSSPATEDPSDPEPETASDTPSGGTVAIISELQPASGKKSERTPSAKTEPSATGERTAAVGPAVRSSSPKLLSPGKYDWVRVSYDKVGLSLLLPKQLFVAEQVASNQQDRLLISSDGRTILRVYRRDSKGSPASLQSYRRELKERRYLGAVVSKDVTLEDGFVLVGRIGQERFFERVYHDCGQPAIHAWMLVYPADQQAFYEKIVEKLSAGYRGSGKAARAVNSACAG